MYVHVQCRYIYLLVPSCTCMYTCILVHVYRYMYTYRCMYILVHVYETGYMYTCSGVETASHAGYCLIHLVNVW